MEEFGDAGIPYSPIVVNSNTGVREALAREGLGPLEQDGAYPSPGLIRFDPSLGIPTLIHVLGLSIEVFIQQVVSPLLRTTKDPLILDLDGDGMELTALAGSTAHFDFGQDGFAERTGWVAPDDGILVIDDNANGTVDGAAELFGSPTQDGFEVLETRDTNGDSRGR